MKGMRDFVIDQMFLRMDEGMSELDALGDLLDIGNTALQLVRTDKLLKIYKSFVECTEELYTEFELLSQENREDYSEAMANGFYRTRYTK